MTTHPPRFLIIDDDRAILVMASKMLAALGCPVFTAASGEEALRLMGTGCIDVVLCDHHMPHLTGVELLELVARLHPRAHRVMMTADLSRDVVAEGLNRGKIDRFLYKPFRSADLHQLVRVFSRPATPSVERSAQPVGTAA